MENDYQINEQDQWSQSPSHSETHYNYVSSDSSLWGYIMSDNQEHSVDKWYLVQNVEAIHWAIYKVNQSIAEVITGLPPLSMSSIKHYLKTFQQSGVSKNDVYMDYITKKLSGCPGSTIAKDLKDVVRFLEWKRTERPEFFLKSNTV